MLQETLEARRAEAGAAYIDHISAAAAHLRRASVPRGAKQVGDRAPDFALAAPDGALVSLSELLRSGPVVLSFFRGEWCPFCRAELEALLAVQPDMARLGANLLLVAPEPPGPGLVADVRRLEPRAYVLHDKMLGVALQYGLVYLVPTKLRQFYVGRDFDISRDLSSGSWLLPMPADFVIQPDGRIAVSYVEPDFTRRLDPAAIIGALDGLRAGP